MTQPRSRVTVNLPAPVRDEVQHEAAMEELPRTEMLRRLRWRGLYFTRRVREGCSILIERPDGVVERVE